ncbi:MAG: glycosyltransferase family 9 protein [Flavobacteriales bacterium]
MSGKRFLIIQTAFVGDAILASSAVSAIRLNQPEAVIDILVRSGNEGLYEQDPRIGRVIVWEKRSNKYVHLFQTLLSVRKEQYHAVINLQRFAASGFLTAFARAHHKVGFTKNPLSFFFTQKIIHRISEAGESIIHETDRISDCLRSIGLDSKAQPEIFIPNTAEEKIAPYLKKEFITISPASVWFTKQYPPHRWKALAQSIPCKVYLLGGKSDIGLCDEIAQNLHHVEVLAGKLSLIESAALMKQAVMNYVNDSAPLHLCSATNAPVCAIFQSTSPTFGFGPLSTQHHCIETDRNLDCKPCGLHGRKECPQQHFLCADIETQALLQVLPPHLILPKK